MKKFLVLLLMMTGTLAVHADSYAYLTFETTDGAKISVPASSLTITFSGTTLTAGSQSFILSNLRKMYFSNSDETSGIGEGLRVENDNTVTAVYDLQGRRVGGQSAGMQMRSGQVYIVKTNSGTHKIVVK